VRAAGRNGANVRSDRYDVNMSTNVENRQQQSCARFALCINKIWNSKVRRYNWHSAGSLGLPSPMLKYKYIFLVEYTEAFYSNSTQKLFWFEITKTLIAVIKINLLCHLLQYSAHFRSVRFRTRIRHFRPISSCRTSAQLPHGRSTLRLHPPSFGIRVVHGLG